MLDQQGGLTRPRRLWTRAAKVFLLVVLPAAVAGGVAWHYLARVSAAPGLAYRFVPGEELVYRVDYASRGAADFRSLFAQQGEAADLPPDPLASVYVAHAALRGELATTVVSREGEGALIAYRFRDPDVRLEVAGAATTQEADSIRQGLTRDIFARVDRRGRLLAVCFDPAVSKASQRLAAGLLAAIQVVLPEASTPRPSRWEAREEDLGGEYVASYEVQADSEEEAPAGAGLTISKTKTQYVEPEDAVGSGGDLGAANAAVPQGEFWARWDLRGGHLASLEMSETREEVVAGKALARSQTTVRLDFQGRRVIPPEELAALREASAAREKQTPAVPLREVESSKEREAALRRAQLGDATLETLLGELGKAEGAGDSTSHVPLILQFRALVHLHPEACASLGKLLAKAPPPSRTMKVLVGALGAAGRAEAQAALAAAVRARPRDWPALWALIPTLGKLASPTPEAEAALWPLAVESTEWNIRSTAQLALGMMARRLARTSPPRAASIVRRFLDALEKSASAQDTRQTLLVLGNAGSRDAMPAMAKFLAHPAPELRSAAVWGLRWIESDPVDALLAKALREDADGGVRREAAAALGLRPPTPATLRSQEQALLHDPEAPVRLTVLDNLWRLRGTRPEVRQPIARAARQDPSEDVRRAAARLLESDRPSAPDTDAQ